MREAVAQGNGFTVEILNQTADGREYWVHIEAHPVRDDAGKVTRFIAIETDVTDRRRTEETLRQATDTALSLAEEKASFLATMSHEIRTPLNAVLGVTALLQDTDLDSEQAGYVATAQRSGNLLLALINDILDFSALESGKIEVETRGFSVHGLMNDVHAMFLTTATGGGLELTYDVANDVPPTVFGDENRIRQVMLNLVSNALKFTTHGGVRMHVDMAPDVDDPDVHNGFALRIAVQDTGIGINADRQERIFQPFTQVDASTTRKYGGTGLGLSICRLIAHHLDGSIELHSEVGKGSCFIFTVPVALTGDTVSGPCAATVHEPEDLSTLRVLLAEDDATNRMVALRMLSRLGVSADVAEDGEQAVEAVRDNDYDLVLMDVHMPRMDGVAATGEIHRLTRPGRRPRIVALTATALEGDRERLLSAGMDGYLSKPVTLAALGTLLGGVSDARSTGIGREDAHDRQPMVTAGTIG
jgi:signal transduction histidine kinase/ActR/RegA family two-component response regulator